MRKAEIVVAGIFALFSIYLMWSSFNIQVWNNPLWVPDWAVSLFYGYGEPQRWVPDWFAPFITDPDEPGALRDWVPGGALAFAEFVRYPELPDWAKDGRVTNIWFDDRGWPGTGFWPFWMAFAMLVCTVWVAINAIARLSPVAQSEEVFLDWFAIKMLLTVGGGVVVMVALAPIISMHAAVGLFLAYYVGILGRHGWKLTLSLAVLTPIVIFLFFDIAMQKTLPKGYADPYFNIVYGWIYDRA